MHLRPSIVNGRASSELRRQLREDRKPLPWVSGATPHHAQLAEASGFRLFGIGGGQAAAHILGLPDAGLMTLTEVVENARRICAAVSIPVIADCEAGFGNIANLIRAVHELIAAGVAGFFLEDKAFPRPIQTSRMDVVPTAEAVAKVVASCDVRNMLDPDVVIIARTDARNAGYGVDEVKSRCDAYLRAGADMLMVVGLRSREEFQAVCSAFPQTPIYVNGSAIDPPLSSDEYRDLGAATYNVSISRIGEMLMADFLEEYRKRGADKYNEFIIDRKRNNDLKMIDITSAGSLEKLENRYREIYIESMNSV